MTPVQTNSSAPTPTIQTTVGELVAQRPGRARLLEQLGIDYCCGGKKPLQIACREQNLDPQTILRVLLAGDSLATPDARPGEDWANATLTALCHHIEATHHAYLRVELPRLLELAQKVAQAHGSRHPETHDVALTIANVANELASHMMKEEQVLFPMVRQLEATTGPVQFHCGSLANPIRVMEMEHDSAGHALETLRELTHDYTLPADACNTFRALYDSLRQFEADMHQHVHKENNILFPRALELEAHRR